MSDLDKLIKNLNKLGKIVTASELDKPAPKKPAPAKTQTPAPAPAPAAPVRKQSSAEDDWDKQFEQFLNQKEKQEGHRIINPLKEDPPSPPPPRTTGTGSLSSSCSRSRRTSARRRYPR